MKARAMDLDDVFSPGGVLEHNIPFYSYRESQSEMASLISEAFSSERIAALEAGTGIGKSFAYLVPAFLAIMNDRKRRVVIATSTITLENQLYEKDIPVINKALKADLPVAILYGRSNYLCLLKFREKEEELSLLLEDDESDFSRFRQWVLSTESGALTDLKIKGALPFFYESASDANTCRGSKCPYFTDCFFYNARKRAKKARIVVTNHHLFILDGKSRYERDIGYDEDLILPEFDYAVLDEAHHIEDEAEKLLSLSYSYEGFRKALDFLLKKDKSIGNRNRIEYMKDLVTEKGAEKVFAAELKSIRDELDIFDQNLSNILPLYTKESEILLDDRLKGVLSSSVELSGELARHIRNAVFSFTRALGEVKTDEDINVSLAMRNINELNCYAGVLSDFFLIDGYKESVPYFVRERSGRYSMLISPMDVGTKLYYMFFSKVKSIILSSATLTVGKDFSHFLSRIGLEKSDVIKARYDSPFNFRRNLLLLVPNDGIPYGKNIEAEYCEYVASECARAIRMSSGGALVLFTSNDMLSAVTEMVRALLPDMKILRQDGRNTNRKKLLDQFKEDKDSSLFATASFWEGVDAPGDTLRLLVISKLPFSPPTSPMNKARTQVLEKEGRSSFMDITLPEAVIKFKQGIGRLIRSENDRGAVLVLDGRLSRKNYRRAFLESIPECYIPDDTERANIPDKLESFLYQ